MNDTRSFVNEAASRGRYVNTGNGPKFQLLDIGHPDYLALIEGSTAFWSLIEKERAGALFCSDALVASYREQVEDFAAEMNTLRFGLQPGAVYFNPTDLCNMSCSYCYIPDEIRAHGQHMSTSRLIDSLEKLRLFFEANGTASKRLPQIVFHGAEPLMNRDAVFAAIASFKDVFEFGIQTNGTLLDDEAAAFFIENEVGIGLSLDSADAVGSDRTRHTRNGKSVHARVLDAIDRLVGYENFSVIATVTAMNIDRLTALVSFFHEVGVPVCMLNPVRCTLPGGRAVKPADHELVKPYLAALELSRELFERSGRKLVIANFANILLGIVAPTARRLMCDISPCGGGRCFFAVSANGDLFPCSEFIGLDAFRGGNLFDGTIDDALNSAPFKRVTARTVEDIQPCAHCAVRHFCGAPCPAEAFTATGDLRTPGAFCELYEAQIRYAFRVLADGDHAAYLYNGWDEGLEDTFEFGSSGKAR